jgi:hypothetical protein
MQKFSSSRVNVAIANEADDESSACGTGMHYSPGDPHTQGMGGGWHDQQQAHNSDHLTMSLCQEPGGLVLLLCQKAFKPHIS